MFPLGPVGYVFAIWLIQLRKDDSYEYVRTQTSCGTRRCHSHRRKETSGSASIVVPNRRKKTSTAVSNRRGFDLLVFLFFMLLSPISHSNGGAVHFGFSGACFTTNYDTSVCMVGCETDVVQQVIYNRCLPLHLYRLVTVLAINNGQVVLVFFLQSNAPLLLYARRTVVTIPDTINTTVLYVPLYISASCILVLRSTYYCISSCIGTWYSVRTEYLICYSHTHDVYNVHLVQSTWCTRHEYP